MPICDTVNMTGLEPDVDVVVDDCNLNQSEVQPGDTVEGQVYVTNRGKDTGLIDIEMRVNGTVIASAEGETAPAEETTPIFLVADFSGLSGGEYTISAEVVSQEIEPV